MQLWECPCSFCRERVKGVCWTTCVGQCSVDLDVEYCTVRYHSSSNISTYKGGGGKKHNHEDIPHRGYHFLVILLTVVFVELFVDVVVILSKSCQHSKHREAAELVVIQPETVQSGIPHHRPNQHTCNDQHHSFV